MVAVSVSSLSFGLFFIAPGSKWSQLFFIFWFIVSVIIGLNLFTALILENFIMRWDKAQKDAIMRGRLLDCAQSAGEGDCKL